jgi:[citrate (pro-3S)-lyase] ligase
MSDYIVSTIYPGDTKGNEKIKGLLEAEGIRKDANIDYTCAIFDEKSEVVATGSCYKNTLRCLAVKGDCQGEGLMNLVVTHLIDEEYRKGNFHLFLYTKCNSARFFKDLGFHEIIRIENQLVFMENRSTGFNDYLLGLEKKEEKGKTAGIVMNCNPISLGHQYLIEKAASENDVLHFFIVSEDSSFFPFAVRKKLILEATGHITNICYHDTGPYMISSATFPSYFQKDSESVIRSQALLDTMIFARIAKQLGIERRYVGEEPTSQVTGIYNQIMKEKLPEYGIDCIEIPRLTQGKEVISASKIRRAIKEDRWDVLTKLAPEATKDFLRSEAAKPVIEKIRQAENVIHD